ncbi:MAG: hypothetical protein R6U37_05365 [Dehalococcoidia bacterium]
MGAKHKTSGKSQKQIREEIIEDWADVRQWIDELQKEWVERQQSPESQKQSSARRTKRGSSSDK